MTNVPLLSNEISVKHFGMRKSIVKNENGPLIKCKLQFSGKRGNLYVNGKKEVCSFGNEHGQPLSHLIIDLDVGDEAVVSMGH